VRHPIGTRVSVGVVPGITPTLLVGDEAVTTPPQTRPGAELSQGA